jgi:integrase
MRSLQVAANLAANLEHFLRWLAKPLDRGGRTFVPKDVLELYHESLAHTFKDLRRHRSRGNRIEPLEADADVALEERISPRKKSNGQFEHPYRFEEACPWKPGTRLRNWIGYRFGRELGLRRGEIGKVRIDDVNLVASHPVIAVRRRPHDPADARRGGNRPRVKSSERELPISSVLAMAIRQYVHTPLANGGRRGARTPYLLVTAVGRPISGGSLDAIWTPVNRRMGFHMSWHVLRHTWAEEHAVELFEEHKGLPDSDLLTVQILRELGGWSVNSLMPFHYIQRAIKRRGDDYLRQRNRRFDEDSRPPAS